jgi:hypothetical protein
LAHLEEQVIKSVHAHCTEAMWLGAYRTTRQWEDEMYAQLRCDEDSDEEEGGDELDVAGEDVVDEEEEEGGGVV